jgi:hypothetical protein
MLPFHLAGDFTVGAFHLVGERAGERVEMKQEAAMAHRYDDDPPLSHRPGDGNVASKASNALWADCMCWSTVIQFL